MTLLSKDVRRECLRTTDGGRPIITTLGACYAMAVKAELRSAQIAKKARRAK